VSTTAAASQRTTAALTTKQAFAIGAEHVRDPAVVCDLVGRFDDALGGVADPIRRVKLLAFAIEGASVELHLLAETLRQRVSAGESREQAKAA
jgi:hypothetical protein